MSQRAQPGRVRVVVLLLVLVPACLGPAMDPVDGALGFLERSERRLAEDGQPALAATVEAVAETGIDMMRWPVPDHPALARLDVHGPEPARPLHAAARAGLRTLPDGTDLLERLEAALPGIEASPSLLDDAFALRALLLLAGPDGRTEAIAARLLDAQHPGGGWPYLEALDPETDATGMVLVALAEADRLPTDAAASAVAFFDALRAEDGGFPQSARPGPVNVHSTAWALRGLLAAGADAAPQHAWLLDRQNPDGGFPVTTGPSSAWATADALGALAAYR